MDGGSIFVVGSFVAACSVKVDRLPRAGETLRATRFVLDPGGKGFNTAVAAHRLGAQVDGVLAVGSDIFADFARNAVVAAGLPQALLLQFPGQTGAGVGFVDRAGENCIAVHPAANDQLSGRDIAAAAARIADARLVTAQFEIGDGPILAAFQEAGRLGITTVLNPSPFRPLTADLLAATRILVVNQTEAAALAVQFGCEHDASGPALWRELAGRLAVSGVDALVVTRGGEGAWAALATGDVVDQPAFPIDAVDTIGAGDAFLGALLAGLWSGRDWHESLRWGVAAGALVASRTGVLDALPSEGELTALLEGNEVR